MAREMKDSGIAWIGRIPSSWNVGKVKYGFFRKNSKAHQANPTVLSLARSGVHIRDLSKNEGQIAESYVEYNPVAVGDLLLNPMDLYSGANCSYSNVAGVISPAYINLRSKDRVDAHFYDYYFKVQYWMMAFFAYGKGVSFDNRWTLSVETLFNWPIVVPAYEEQLQISGFLGRKCAEIDAVLEKTCASIEEYKKLKQAIITQTVTKGIRGDRLMKESGIEWVDAIPREIKVSRLGLHYDIILGKMLCSTQVDETYTLEPYYCAADVHFEGISDSERKMMWFNPFEKELYLVKKHDLLVVEGGAGAGGCAIIVDGETPTYIQNSIMIVRAKHSGDCRYVRYWLECLVRQGYIDVVCNKATIPHFTKDKLSAVPYFVFSEQERNEIADYLDKQCKEIDILIQKKERSLAELESYKKSLVYEYVTGKREVDKYD